MNRKVRRCLNVVLGLLVAVAWSMSFLPNMATSETPAREEIRGVWLTNVGSDVLFVPGAVHHALQELSDLNFNTVYPVVWNRGQTFYPSVASKQVTGRSQDWLLSLMRGTNDVLGEIIADGQSLGLRVVPWFEYGFMAPANSELVKRHPDWVTRHQDNSENLREEELAPIFIENPLTIQQVWLNPLHPEVQNFLLRLIVEVVANYPIDSIQFDDNFGLPVELGYDPYTIALYQAEHWGYSPPSNPYNAQWVRWRANKINDFMERIYQAVQFVNPDCAISLAANSQSFAYRHYLQDWLTWVEAGWIDELFLQVYHSELSRFETELDISTVWYARNLTPVGVGILSGTMKRPISFAEIEARVKVARDRQFAGFAFFYWESLWGKVASESPEQRRNSFQALFSEPAISPVPVRSPPKKQDNPQT